MKSILSLPPALQAVWTAVYAAGISGELSRYRADGETSLPSADSLAGWAENHAWEAVRRANGGEMPEVPGKTDDKTWKRSVMREALLWFADEGHYDGTYRHGAGFVDAVGIEKAREALGIPVERHDGSLMPLAEALTHGAAIGADVDEPTDEEMVEALAPTVAELSHGPLAWGRNKPFHETWVEHTRQCLAGIENTWSVEFRQHCAIALASWKAARAWGRK